jgi:hypothetical protein
MANKVIFLDIDGVLKPMLSKFKSVKGISSSCLVRLKQLVKSTGASIILSSTWRNHPTALALLTEVMGRFNLTYDGVTPNAESVNDTRGMEISSWLTEHPEVECYVILDDYPEEQFAGHEKHFVNINFYTGLTVSDTEKAKKILQGRN